MIQPAPDFDRPRTRLSGIHKTTCCYCGVGCGIEIQRDRNGELSLRGDADHPANRGMLCGKGKTLLHVAASRANRLTEPFMRASRRSATGGVATPVTWDHAIGHIAGEFKRIIAAHGPDAVGFYGSGQCLTEEYYLINKIAKGFLGTNNFDTNSRLCMSAAVTGYKLTLGADGPPTTYADIDLADTFLVAGANPAWCHPVLFRRMEARKQADSNVKVIVVDPRRTGSCSIADLHLQIIPGTDVALYNALARELWKTDQLDWNFIENHTTGWPEMAAAIEPYTAEAAAIICGIPAADIRKAAQWLGGDRRFLSMWTMGLNQSSRGVDKNIAIIALSLITGKISRPGSGPMSLTGQPNAMGGREVGGMATLLPAHRDMANPDHRQAVADYWGVKSIPAKAGLTAVEMFQSLGEGKMKAIWIVATNPLASLPNSWQVQAALEKAELVVVQDIYAGETSELADVILPAATWLEKTGTMTNAERRISLLEKVIDPPGTALPDVDILLGFADAMGWGEHFQRRTPADIFDQHVGLTAGTDVDITGLSHSLLQSHGPAQWPFPSGAAHDRAVDSRLYADHQFATPDGRARLHPIAYAPPAEMPDADFPLVVTTGRVRDQWHTMTKTGQVSKLRRHTPSPTCDMHPDDAAPRGIGDGDMIRLVNRRGEIRVPAHLTTDIRAGTIFVPMHWGQRENQAAGRVNNLTSPAMDAKSSQPELKFATVNAIRYTPPPRKIILAGAGAAAMAFIRAHRAFNTQDRILLFSAEKELVYNRVMLPMYINQTRRWPELLVATAEELAALGVEFHPQAPISQLALARKKITTGTGAEHDYDVLILATGSRPLITWQGPLPQTGVYTLRTRGDADRISADARTTREVAIIGGGLLGIELAAALNDRGLNVTLVHRSSRLMSRQLDAIAADLLKRELLARGIKVTLRSELAGIQGLMRPEHVRLSTGETLPAGMVVFATGVEPRADLGRAAGLKAAQGICVDEFLRTSQPDVFAIGECAQLQGHLFGTTAAAQAHGRALAEYLRGNVHAPFRPVPAGNVLKISDFQLASAGETDPPDSPDTQVISLTDTARGYYQKCVVRQDRLVGMVMVGDTSRYAEWLELLQNGTELESLRSGLLRPGSGPAAPMEGKLICSCHQVGEQTIRRCSGQPGATLADVVQTTRAGSACGSCRPEISAILTQCAKIPPDSAPPATPFRSVALGVAG